QAEDIRTQRRAGLRHRRRGDSTSAEVRPGRSGADGVCERPATHARQLRSNDGRTIGPMGEVGEGPRGLTCIGIVVVFEVGPNPINLPLQATVVIESLVTVASNAR